MKELSSTQIFRLAEAISTPVPPMEFARLLVTVNSMVGIAHEEGYLEGLRADLSAPEPPPPGDTRNEIPAAGEANVLSEADYSAFFDAAQPDIQPPDIQQPAQPAERVTQAETPKPTSAASRKGEPWTPEECRDALRMKAEGLYPSQIAKALRRPTEATRAQLKRLVKDGITPTSPDEDVRCGQRHDAWTKEEDARLIKLLSTMTNRQAANVLGRTAEAVANRARRFKSLSNRPSIGARSAWTDAADNQLIEGLRSGTPRLDLAASLGRTAKAVEVRIVRLRKAGRLTEQPAASPPVPAPETVAIVPAATDDLPEAFPAEAPGPAAPVAAAPSQAKNRPLPPQPDLATSGLTARQCRLVKHMDQLEDEFTSADDIALIDGIIARIPAEMIGADLGCDRATVIARFKAMKTDEIIVPQTGALTIDGQRDMVTAARWRADRDADRT